MMSRLRLKIVGGPNRQEIMENVIRSCTKKHKKIIFVVEDRMCYEGDLNFLEYTDGTRDTFKFKGFFNKGQLLEGFYNLIDHKGWIEFHPL